MKRVLVTCVGSGVGQSVVDSLRFRKDKYFLIGSDQNRYCYALTDCDKFLELPAIADPNYLEAMQQACRAEGIDIVVPGHDQELEMFAKDRQKFADAGAAVMIADAGLVGLLRDKLAWSKEFRKKTWRVVESASASEVRSGQSGLANSFPLIAKPAGGSASAGLRILKSSEDLETVPDSFVVQRFLFPDVADPEAEVVRSALEFGRVAQVSEISVQLVYSTDAKLLARFASKNRLKAGIPINVHPIDSREIWQGVDELQEVLSHYEPRGPINLQGRMTSDGLVFFEMNPRFTGITGNRAQFGFNEVSLLVDNFIDGATRELPVNTRKVGVRQVACRAWPSSRFEFRSSAEQESKTLVITGGTGWLARNVATQRDAGGDSIIVTCRDESVDRATDIYREASDVRVIGLGAPELGDALASADVLLNLASARPPDGPVAILDSHKQQLRVLDFAEAGAIPKIVNISSQSVYDLQSDVARDENAPPAAESPYAFSKHAIEASVESLAWRCPSIQAVSLRLARLFGPAPGLRMTEFPHRVIDALLNGESIDLWNPADALDLLDIRDAMRAIDFAIDHSDATWRGEVFNVGTGKPVSVADYVTQAASIGREHYRASNVLNCEATKQVRLVGLDCDKFARAGWSAEIPVERSILNLFEYISNDSR